MDLASLRGPVGYLYLYLYRGVRPGRVRCRIAAAIGGGDDAFNTFFSAIGEVVPSGSREAPQIAERIGMPLP